MRVADEARVPVPILDLDEREFHDEVRGLLESTGEPPYRRRQLEEWVYRRTPAAFDVMSDLPRDLRRRLAERFVLHPLHAHRELASADGTRKFLWQRQGAGDSGGALESVLIPDGERVTYCISSQLGCPVKCPFCATGHGGFQGQLRPAEIVDQVLQMRERTALPPTNIVFMGMGGPLLNFDAVLRSLAILIGPRQLGFGARRITVSTVGIPQRILDLGQRFPQVKLALSLHAARDDLRDELVPMNRKHPLAEVLGAVKTHARSTGRKPTMEYVILPGVNDSRDDAAALGELLKDLPCRINLIGFNPFPEASYRKPPVREMLRFRKQVEARFHGPVTLRRSRGEDIQGACGQLSLREAAERQERDASPPAGS